MVLAEHKNSPGRTDGWEVFDEEQYEATLAASRAIVDAYDIGIDDVVGHDEISPGRKVDPGPAFAMDKFRARLFGRDADDWNDMLYRVRSDSGLNMRTGAGVDNAKIKLLADGATVNVIERHGVWWLVAEVIDGKDDTTGFVHSNWLRPA